MTKPQLRSKAAEAEQSFSKLFDSPKNLSPKIFKTGKTQPKPPSSQLEVERGAQHLVKHDGFPQPRHGINTLQKKNSHTGDVFKKMEKSELLGNFLLEKKGTKHWAGRWRENTPVHFRWPLPLLTPQLSIFSFYRKMVFSTKCQSFSVK